MSARPTPGADHAADALRKAVEKPYQQARARAHELGAMRTAMNGITDIVLLLGAINNLSLAADALKDAAEELHKQADAALTASMASTGCTTFSTASHTVSVRDGLPSVEIISAAAVPPEYLKQPPPQPDKSAIRQFLVANGGSTNWARITRGAPFLSRRTTT